MRHLRWGNHLPQTQEIPKFGFKIKRNREDPERNSHQQDFDTRAEVFHRVV
jgi:hypothetical protein